MELRRTKLIQELREAREELLDINFARNISSYFYRAPVIDCLVPRGYTNISNLYGLVLDWLHKWSDTFTKSNTLGHGMVNIQSSVMTMIDGSQRENDPEVFNELRPVFVGYIDMGLSILDQEYQVKPLTEDYAKRVKDTKLAVMLNEFNAVRDIAPNLSAIGFRTILCLVLQEKAKRINIASNTAISTNLSVMQMLKHALDEHILLDDEERRVKTFLSIHKDRHDFVAHRPGAENLVDKSEVDTMVDLLT